MLSILLVFLVFATGNSDQDQWVVQLKSGIEPADFAQEHGLVYGGPVSFLPGSGYHIFHASHTNGRARAIQSLRENPTQVQWAELQEKRPRQYTRVLGSRIPDPLYESQWHLHTHPFGVDADYVGNRTGQGITIAIVDDGLQHTHPDLAANYDAPHSWDFNGNDPDPRPESTHDGHGTAAAGVAAAVKDNGHCGRGVAPKAKIVGLRTIADSVTDLTEAQALTHNAIGVVDIFSCSWGPADDGIGMVGPGPIVTASLALYAGSRRGRLGKGTIYVWASGNGRDVGDSCAFDGYAANMFVNAIGAIDHTGKQSWYSEGCAALMAVTPSSGAMKGITTVDLVGSAGYDPGECTATFGGTSSAAPLAAGIIALILEERPEFTWRDVKHVLAKGATPIQVEDPDWHMNGRGYRHSHKYGFGLLKVPTLLDVARRHALVPVDFAAYRSPVVTTSTKATMIPCRYTYEVKDATGISFIEHVTLYLGITHEKRGHIKISMISPEGTVSVLAPERHRDTTANYPLDGWSFMSVRHWGESTVNGNWTLIFEDSNNRTAGRGHFNGFRLGIYGY
jgi:hypothetical protein